MAIIGKVKTEYGIDCQYHNIRQWRQHQKELQFAIYSYVNKQARQENKRPIVMTRIVLPKWNNVEQLEQQGMNHLKYCYNYLMQDQQHQIFEDIDPETGQPIVNQNLVTRRRIQNYLQFDGQFYNDEEDIEDQE